MKKCWFRLVIMSGCLLSLVATADNAEKAATSSLAASNVKQKSGSEAIITNEADYAELVRAREIQQATSATSTSSKTKSSSKSSQASSKVNNL